MEHQSVFYLANNMMYVDNKTITDIQELDTDLVPKDLSSYITSMQNYWYIYDHIRDDLIDPNNRINLNNTLAYKILYVVYRLRIAFEYRTKQKDGCYLNIPYEPDNTNTKITNKRLTPDQQFNIYLYMFNENSMVKIPNRENFNSKFRMIVNITLDVIKNNII